MYIYFPIMEKSKHQFTGSKKPFDISVFVGIEGKLYKAIPAYYILVYCRYGVCSFFVNLPPENVISEGWC